MQVTEDTFKKICQVLKGNKKGEDKWKKMRIYVNDGFKFSNIFFSFLFFFPVRKYAGDECCNVMASVTDSEEDTNAKDLEKWWKTSV